MKPTLTLLTLIFVFWSASILHSCKTSNIKSDSSVQNIVGPVDSTAQSIAGPTDSSNMTLMTSTCNDCTLPSSSSNKICQFALQTGDHAYFSCLIDSSVDHTCPPYCMVLIKRNTSPQPTTNDTACVNCILRFLNTTGTCSVTLPAGMQMIISGSGGESATQVSGGKVTFKRNGS